MLGIWNGKHTPDHLLHFMIVPTANRPSFIKFSFQLLISCVTFYLSSVHDETNENNCPSIVTRFYIAIINSNQFNSRVCLFKSHFMSHLTLLWHARIQLTYQKTILYLVYVFIASKTSTVIFGNCIEQQLGTNK